MDYRERIEAKVGILFQIADQYLSGQIPLDQAKELISCEMVHVRPAQVEAMKAELGERLKEAGSQPESEKLFELFKNYVSPPYHKLQTGHPLRNYYEENSRVRTYLLRVDEMESEEVTCEGWKEIYELLNGFRVHIERQEKNFYPLLIPMGMRLQVEKAKELGNVILDEIEKNRERLKNGDLVDFLYNQRSLSQVLMNYLDLEERVLYPKALIRFTDQDFARLRRSDDKERYAYMEQPADFVPKETGKDIGNAKTDAGLILPALLVAKDLGIICYSLSGEIVSIMGNQIAEPDLQIPEETRRGLLDGKEKQKEYRYSQGNQTYLITYSLVRDNRGECQGILKIKENVSEINNNRKENISEREVNRKENRKIDSTQNIAELFKMYPKFHVDFYNLDEELKGLKGQMEMQILKESTVEMLAKSLRIDTADLVNRINKSLESY